MTLIDNPAGLNIQEFDFSSFLTDEDNRVACSIIDHLIDVKDLWQRDAPKYQTHSILFDYAPASYEMMRIRLSYLVSCYSFLGKEVGFRDIISWGLRFSSETPLETGQDLDDIDLSTRDHQWHQHTVATIPWCSGVYYAHIPEDYDISISGTEFADCDPNKNPDAIKFQIHPKPFTWYIWQSEYWHRPCAGQSNSNRYIISADLDK